MGPIVSPVACPTIVFAGSLDTSVHACGAGAGCRHVALCAGWSPSLLECLLLSSAKCGVLGGQGFIRHHSQTWHRAWHPVGFQHLILGEEM